VKRIVADGDKVLVKYNLPIPLEEGKQMARVLPIDTLTGAEGIRTPDLLRAREALSQLSYSPR
jgi:site-specific DNA recombinase